MNFISPEFVFAKFWEVIKNRLAAIFQNFT